MIITTIFIFLLGMILAPFVFLYFNKTFHWATKESFKECSFGYIFLFIVWPIALMILLYNLLEAAIAKKLPNKPDEPRSY